MLAGGVGPQIIVTIPRQPKIFENLLSQILRLASFRKRPDEARGTTIGFVPQKQKTRSQPGKLASLCAGINRHDVENERVLQERSSDPS